VAKKKKKLVTAGSVIVSHPPPGKCYVMSDHKLCVVGEATSPVDRVEMVVLLESETVDWDNHTITTRDGLPGYFSEEVAYGNSETPPETGNFKLLLRPFVGTTAQDVLEILFKRVPGSETHTVFATQSLWYALIPDDSIAGPNGFDDPVGDYTPVEMRIPWNAESVSFSASGTWRHGSSAPDNGPEGGTHASPPLQVPGYQHVTYGSDVIATIQTNVCKLLGLWYEPVVGDDDEADAQPFKQFEIGANLAGKTIPADPKMDGRLFLGMHDGRRWHNNLGSVVVDVTWNPPTCTELFKAFQKKQKARSRTKKSQKSKKD